jgi:hypothetical protein
MKFRVLKATNTYGWKQPDFSPNETGETESEGKRGSFNDIRTLESG